MEKNKIDIKPLLDEYLALRDRKNVIEARLKELTESIKTYATKNGNKDGNGSYFMKEDNITFGSQAKKKITLNFDKTRDLLKSKGLWRSVVEKQEVINEKKFEELVQVGDISQEELEEIVDTKVQYAISISKEKEEEMPEIEIVDSKKKKLPFKKRSR